VIPRVLPTIILTATIALSGCGDDSATVAMVPSSFTGLTVEIDRALDTETDWIIAGSSRLVRQLADGATADLLITADADTMREAVAQRLVSGEPVTIAANRLVVALAPGNPGGLDDLDDLRDPALLLGVCAAEVPCGRLAAEVREAIDLSVSVDTEEPNVRALALKIAGGELDAGLIYATDAQDLGLDTLGEGPLDAFVTEYRAASVADGPAPIIEFLRSDPGRALLTAAGFGVP
jgi:molybdate transport system substrate-binding protein